MSEKKILNMNMDIELWNKVNEVAKKEDRGISNWVRWQIKKIIKEIENGQEHTRNSD